MKATSLNRAIGFNISDVKLIGQVCHVNESTYCNLG